MSERYSVKLDDEVVITSNDLNAAWDRYGDLVKEHGEDSVTLWDSAKEVYIIGAEGE